MKYLREFALTTKFDKIGFLPGDIIHGDLYIFLEQPVELQAIEVFLYGIGCGAWLEQCDLEVENSPKAHDSSGIREKARKRKLVDIGLLLFGFSEPRINKAQKHEEGRFVYEFEINVPEKLPFSFKSPVQKDLGYARYYLKAVMSRPKKRTKITKIPIVINELVDPDRPDLAFLPGSFQEKNLRTACLPTGSLSLECYLSKSHYKQGENILIQALAQNCSPKVLKEMYARLIRRVRCKSSFGTNTFTSNEASIRGTKIPAQSTVEWKREEMKVPPVGPTIAGNREIRIDYMVRIGMYEDLGCEVHLDLPVVIGTVGLPDWNKRRGSRLFSTDQKNKTNNSKSMKYKEISKGDFKQIMDSPTSNDVLRKTIPYNDDKLKDMQNNLSVEIPTKQELDDTFERTSKEKSQYGKSCGCKDWKTEMKSEKDQMDRLKEPARGIQKALDDIDDDMSRIKRRLSEAKESVSKSFELDIDKSDDMFDERKYQLYGIKVPAESMLVDTRKEMKLEELEEPPLISEPDNNDKPEATIHLESITKKDPGSIEKGTQLDDQGGVNRDWNIPSFQKEGVKVYKREEPSDIVTPAEMTIPFHKRNAILSRDHMGGISIAPANENDTGNRLERKAETSIIPTPIIPEVGITSKLPLEIGKNYNIEREIRRNVESEKMPVISSTTDKPTYEEVTDAPINMKVSIEEDEIVCKRYNKDENRVIQIENNNDIVLLSSSKDEPKLPEQIVDDRNDIPLTDGRLVPFHVRGKDLSKSVIQPFSTMKYPDNDLILPTNKTGRDIDENDDVQVKPDPPKTSEYKENHHLLRDYEESFEIQPLHIDEPATYPYRGSDIIFERTSFKDDVKVLDDSDSSLVKTRVVFPSNKTKDIQKPILKNDKEFHPRFVGHNKRIMKPLDEIAGGYCTDTVEPLVIDFKGIVHSTEKDDNKDFDERLKKYLETGTKIDCDDSKMMFDPKYQLSRKMYRKSDKGYEERMNKSMDAINGYSTDSYSDDALIIDFKSIANTKKLEYDELFQERNKKYLESEAEGKIDELALAKRYRYHGRFKGFHGRMNKSMDAINGYSTDSLSGDDQIVIDFKGVEGIKTKDVRKVFNDRVRKYADEEKEKPESIDTIPASSSTDSYSDDPLTTDFKGVKQSKIGYGGKSKHLVEPTPILSSNEKALKYYKSEEKPWASKVHPEYVDTVDTPSYSKNLSKNDKCINMDVLEMVKKNIPEEKHNIPFYKVSDETANIFLRLATSSNSHLSRGKENAYNENLSQKFLISLQTDVKSKQVDTIDGFQDTISKAKEDFNQLQENRLNDYRKEKRNILLGGISNLKGSIKKFDDDIDNLREDFIEHSGVAKEMIFSTKIQELEESFHTFEYDFDNFREKFFVSVKKVTKDRNALEDLESSFNKFDNGFEDLRLVFIESLKKDTDNAGMNTILNLAIVFDDFNDSFETVRCELTESLKNIVGRLIDDIRPPDVKQIIESRPMKDEMVLDFLPDELNETKRGFMYSSNEDALDMQVSVSGESVSLPLNDHHHDDASNMKIKLRDIKEIISKYFVSHDELHDGKNSQVDDELIKQIEGMGYVIILSVNDELMVKEKVPGNDQDEMQIKFQQQLNDSTTNTTQDMKVWGSENNGSLGILDLHCDKLKTEKIYMNNNPFYVETYNKMNLRQLDENVSLPTEDIIVSYEKENLRSLKDDKNEKGISRGDKEDFPGLYMSLRDDQGISNKKLDALSTIHESQIDKRKNDLSNITISPTNFDSVIPKDDEITMDVSLTKEEIKRPFKKDSETDDDIFPVSDKSDERYTEKLTNYKCGYTPVPYKPLLEEDVILTDKKYTDKPYFEVNLVCKSTSEESLNFSNLKVKGESNDYSNRLSKSIDLINVDDEEKNLHNYDNNLHNYDKNLHNYDDVFEALREKFFEGLKNERLENDDYEKDVRDMKMDVVSDLESTFNRLDDYFDEIRQSFVDRLKKEKNSMDCSTIDNIEENLNKFDDNFEEIRQKFIESLKRESGDGSNVNEVEASFDKLDDNFEELRQKFMKSLKNEKKDEESRYEVNTKSFEKYDESFEELREKFLHSITKDDRRIVRENEKTYSNATSDPNDTYTKISGWECQSSLDNEEHEFDENCYELLEESSNKIRNYHGTTSFSKDSIPNTPCGKEDNLNIENQNDISQFSPSNDVSWLDLNTLGQFGPEEFSVSESKCILPSCKEIVILHEPRDMPQFKQHSYSPQYIKDLQDNIKPDGDKKGDGIEFDNEDNEYSKKQKKGSSKIRTKIKSRSKFMGDAHIVTDEPKHAEPSNLANRSWLDLNTVGQLGPEEEICSDNQFVLPSGKEIIILGEGKHLSDSDHNIQLSNLRRQSLGKANELRRRSSGKESDATRKQSSMGSELRHRRSLGKRSDIHRTSSTEKDIIKPNDKEKGITKTTEKDIKPSKDNKKDKTTCSECLKRGDHRMEGKNVTNNCRCCSKDIELIVEDNYPINENGITDIGDMTDFTHVTTLSPVKLSSFDECVSSPTKINDRISPESPSSKRYTGKNTTSRCKLDGQVARDNQLIGIIEFDVSKDKSSVSDDLDDVSCIKRQLSDEVVRKLSVNDEFHRKLEIEEDKVRTTRFTKNYDKTVHQKESMNEQDDKPANGSDRSDDASLEVKIEDENFDNLINEFLKSGTKYTKEKDQIMSNAKITGPYKKALINQLSSPSVSVDKEESDIKATFDDTYAPVLQPQVQSSTSEYFSSEQISILGKDDLTSDSKYRDSNATPAISTQRIELTRDTSETNGECRTATSSVYIKHSTTELDLDEKAVESYEERTSKSFEPPTTSTTVYAGDESFVDTSLSKEAETHKDNRELKDENEGLVVDSSGGFLLRAKNYMKSFFQFNSSGSDVSDKEGKSSDEIKEWKRSELSTRVNHIEQQVSPSLNTINNQNEFKDVKPTHKRLQSDESFKSRSKKIRKPSIDMDATDNFIEELSSLITDETETSELATTGDSSVTNLKSCRKPGPEERYTSQHNLAALAVNNEIPMVVDQIGQQSKDDEEEREIFEEARLPYDQHIIDKEFKPYRKSGIDMDATENLIEDIYLVTDEPCEPETLITVSPKKSTQCEGHYLSNDKIEYDQDLPTIENTSMFIEEGHDREDKFDDLILAEDLYTEEFDEFDHRAKLSLSAQFREDENFETTVKLNREDAELSHELDWASEESDHEDIKPINKRKASDEDFKNRAKKFTDGSSADEATCYVMEDTKACTGGNTFSDFSYLDIKKSKHIGPEEMSSADDKSLLALDKELILQDNYRQERLDRKDDFSCMRSIKEHTIREKAFTKDIINEHEVEDVDADMEKEVSSFAGFKHGPEEWITEQKFIISSETEIKGKEENFQMDICGVKSTIERQVTNDDQVSTMNLTEEKTSQNASSDMYMTRENLINSETTTNNDINYTDLIFTRQNNLLAKNDTFDVLTNKDVDILDDSKDIRTAKKIIYGQEELNASREYFDRPKQLTDNEVMTEEESIVFDVVVDFEKSGPDSSSIHNEKVLSTTSDTEHAPVNQEVEIAPGITDLDYPEITFSHRDRLEELKRLHCKTYSETDTDSTENNEYTDRDSKMTSNEIKHHDSTTTDSGEKKQETTKVVDNIKPTRQLKLEPLYLETDEVKSDERKITRRQHSSPSSKRKRKLRDKTTTVYPNEARLLKTQNNQQIDLQVSVVKDKNTAGGAKKNESPVLTGKKKSPDGGLNKQLSTNKPNNKRKEWKLDFGGNLRPAPMKGNCGNKEFGTFVLVQDSPNGKKKKGKSRKEIQTLNKGSAKIKKRICSPVGCKDKEKDKEKKTRALKVINLTVEKDKEFKRLSKAIKKKLSGKKVEDKFPNTTRKTLSTKTGKENLSNNIQKRSTFKKDDKKELIVFKKKLISRSGEKLYDDTTKDGQKKRRKISAGRLSTSSSEDICSLPHAIRLEAESNRRNALTGKEGHAKGKKCVKTKTILFGEKGERRKGKDIINAVHGKQTTSDVKTSCSEEERKYTSTGCEFLTEGSTLTDLEHKGNILFSSNSEDQSIFKKEDENDQSSSESKLFMKSPNPLLEIKDRTKQLISSGHSLTPSVHKDEDTRDGSIFTETISGDDTLSKDLKKVSDEIDISSKSDVENITYTAQVVGSKFHKTVDAVMLSKDNASPSQMMGRLHNADHIKEKYAPQYYKRERKDLSYDDKELHTLSNTMLTSSFRSRAANKLSSPDCRSIGNKGWSVEGSHNVDELEYEIDWETLKRGLKEPDSSSSYFTAEEVSKQSSLESAGSSPREQDAYDCASLKSKSIVDCSEAPSNEEFHSDVSEKKYNNDKLFVAGNIKPKSKPSTLFDGVDTFEKHEDEVILDLRFTWDNVGDVRKEGRNKKKSDDEYDPLVVDKSSSDRDSGITSSGEETSKIQVPESFKKNFLERPIYKLQSISEEDKLTDDEIIGQCEEIKEGSGLFSTSLGNFSDLKYDKTGMTHDTAYPYTDGNSNHEKSLIDKGLDDNRQLATKNIHHTDSSTDEFTSRSQTSMKEETVFLPNDVSSSQSFVESISKTFHDNNFDEEVFVGRADPTMYPLSFKESKEQYSESLSRERLDTSHIDSLLLNPKSIDDMRTNLDEEKPKYIGKESRVDFNVYKKTDSNFQDGNITVDPSELQFEIEDENLSTPTAKPDSFHDENKDQNTRSGDADQQITELDELNSVNIPGVLQERRTIAEDNIDLFFETKIQYDDVGSKDKITTLLDDIHVDDDSEIKDERKDKEVHNYESSVKTCKQNIPPEIEEEEMYLKEFERLREFERLEEAFQEGKTSLPLVADEKDVKLIASALTDEGSTTPTETTDTIGVDGFYIRQPMTPITEESGSSIEEGRIETKKPGKHLTEDKVGENSNEHKQNDDDYLLFNPGRAFDDIDAMQTFAIKNNDEIEVKASKSNNKENDNVKDTTEQTKKTKNSKRDTSQGGTKKYTSEPHVKAVDKIKPCSEVGKKFDNTIQLMNDDVKLLDDKTYSSKSGKKLNSDKVKCTNIAKSEQVEETKPSKMVKKQQNKTKQASKDKDVKRQQKPNNNKTEKSKAAILTEKQCDTDGKQVRKNKTAITQEPRKSKKNKDDHTKSHATKRSDMTKIEKKIKDAKSSEAKIPVGMSQKYQKKSGKVSLKKSNKTCSSMNSSGSKKHTLYKHKVNDEEVQRTGQSERTTKSKRIKGNKNTDRTEEKERRKKNEIEGRDDESTAQGGRVRVVEKVKKEVNEKERIKQCNGVAKVSTEDGEHRKTQFNRSNEKFHHSTLDAITPRNHTIQCEPHIPDSPGYVKSKQPKTIDLTNLDDDDTHTRKYSSDKMDTSGLDIIVTDITSTSKGNKKDVNIVRKRSFETKKKKEKEVNKKVLKVIKLFTEAISKKEMTEGSTADKCISQQIMNSIFNAAKQSSYFEEESNADFTRTFQEQPSIIKLDTPECRNIVSPAAGTAVQQYKKLTSSSEKSKKLTSRKSSNKTKVKLNRLSTLKTHFNNHTENTSIERDSMRNTHKTSKNMKGVIKEEVSNKYEHNKKEDSAKSTNKDVPKVLKKYGKNTKTKGTMKRVLPSMVMKHVDGASRQRKISPFSPRRKIKLSNLSRKLLTGTYVSPYRQQLKRTNQLDELTDKEDKEEDEYREIEVDVKIKVTQREENIPNTDASQHSTFSEYVTEDNKTSTQPKKDTSRSRSSSVSKLTKSETQSKIPVIEQCFSLDSNERKTSDLLHGRNREINYGAEKEQKFYKSSIPCGRCNSETSRSAIIKTQRDWLVFDVKRNGVKRSSSERSLKTMELKREVRKEKRRLSTPTPLISYPNRPTFDKVKSDMKSSPKQKYPLEIESKLISNVSEVEKKGRPYVTNLGLRGPIFPYVGYIERKDLDISKEKIKHEKHVSRRRSGNLISTIQPTKDSSLSLTMITSSKPADGVSVPVLKQTGAFDSSFAIMSSMSNEFTGDSMLCHSGEEERKAEIVKAGSGHLAKQSSITEKDMQKILVEKKLNDGKKCVRDVKTKPDGISVTEVRPKEFEETVKDKKYNSLLNLNVERERGRRSKSVNDDCGTKQKPERKSRSLECKRTENKINSSIGPIIHDILPKKTTSSKIYHTLPANTGGGNLYVESRGAILPYIGHIERLDMEITKSESDIKHKHRSEFDILDTTATSKPDDMKIKDIGIGPLVSSPSILTGKKVKPLSLHSEAATATVRSSTPNNVALEVKIPIPAELSSSLDPSESPTLTFNIDVSLENSSDDMLDPDSNGSTSEKLKKKTERREEKGKYLKNNNGRKKIKSIQKFGDKKVKFDGKVFKEENSLICSSKIPTYHDIKQKQDNNLTTKLAIDLPNQHISDGAIDIDVEIDCTSVSSAHESQSHGEGTGYHTSIAYGGADYNAYKRTTHIDPVSQHTSLPDIIIPSDDKTPSPTSKSYSRSIYPYNHFKCQQPQPTPPPPKTATVEREVSGRRSRKSWPTDTILKPFQNKTDLHSQVISSQQKFDKTINSANPKGEERICLGGGLVFNITKKQAIASRVGRKQTSTPSRTTSRQHIKTTSAVDTKKTSKRSSIPPKSIPKYISRSHKNMANVRKDPFKRPSSSYKMNTASSLYDAPIIRSEVESKKVDHVAIPNTNRKENGLNEEKVNNLVSDIKDAGATISDILDEMQALKMFLNEEEEKKVSNIATTTIQTRIHSESDILVTKPEYPWESEFSDGNASHREFYPEKLSPKKESNLDFKWEMYPPQETNGRQNKTLLVANYELDADLQEDSQKATECISTLEITTPSQSFKDKLKEELARTISATLQELHPYKNKFNDDIKGCVSYTSPTRTLAHQIPSMDDTLREIRTSTEDGDSDQLVNTTIQLYNISFSRDVPTYTHAKEGHSTCTFMHSSLDQNSTASCHQSKYSILDIKGKDTMKNSLSTVTKYTTLPEMNGLGRNNKPPPKSYVRPIIFPKIFSKQSPCDQTLDRDQSLDSGLYNTNSTEDCSFWPPEVYNHVKPARESFEQQEMSLGIIDENGRLRRNSELMRDLNGERSKYMLDKKDTVRTVLEIDATETDTCRTDILDNYDGSSGNESEEKSRQPHSFSTYPKDDVSDTPMDIGQCETEINEREMEEDFSDEYHRVNIIENHDNNISPTNDRQGNSISTQRTSSDDSSYTSSVYTTCVLSPPQTNNYQTSPTITPPYESFKYEEEIIESYQLIDHRPHHQHIKIKSDELATLRYEVGSPLYESNTGVNPLERRRRMSDEHNLSTSFFLKCDDDIDTDSTSTSTLTTTTVERDVLALECNDITDVIKIPCSTSHIDEDSQININMLNVDQNRKSL